MVFHSSLSDSKFPQVSRTFLSILADFNNAVVWMVSTRPLISMFSSPFINPLMTVSRTPITIRINVTYMFNFTLWSAGTAKLTILQILFFLLIIIRSGRLADIRWSVCMSNSQRSLSVSFFRTDVRLCICNCSYVQISSGSLCPPSGVWSYTLSVLICGIHLLYDWWFRLYPYITYICCFVASYLFSLWYDWFL